MPLYRERIYKKYVNARLTALAPQTIARLKDIAPYPQKMIHKYFPSPNEEFLFRNRILFGDFTHELAFTANLLFNYCYLPVLKMFSHMKINQLFMDLKAWRVGFFWKFLDFYLAVGSGVTV